MGKKESNPPPPRPRIPFRKGTNRKENMQRIDVLGNASEEMEFDLKKMEKFLANPETDHVRVFEK